MCNENFMGIPFESIRRTEDFFNSEFELSPQTATVYTLFAIFSLVCENFTRRNVHVTDNSIDFEFEDNEDASEENVPSIYRRFILHLNINEKDVVTIKLIMVGKVYYKVGNGSDVSASKEITETRSLKLIDSMVCFILSKFRTISNEVRDEINEILEKFSHRVNWE